MILKPDFAYLFTILNMNGSKLPNARGLPNLIILPPCITSLCIFNTPVFIQTRKKTPHINKQKKWDNDPVQPKAFMLRLHFSQFHLIDYSFHLKASSPSFYDTTVGLFSFNHCFCSFSSTPEVANHSCWPNSACCLLL